MTDKPLSETHPTLWENIVDDDSIESPNLVFAYRTMRYLIQSTTVDIAEFESIKKTLHSAVNNYGESERLRGEQMIEVERLKRELATLKETPILYWYLEGRNYGNKKSAEEIQSLKKELDITGTMLNAIRNEQFKLGERRAIERIRKRCNECCLVIGGVCEKHIDWNLGLSEEEKK